MGDKFYTITSIIFYYILVILGSVFNFVFGLLSDNIIGNTSTMLFYLLYIILPIFLLLSPIFFYINFKRKCEKIILYSYITAIIYIVLFFSTVLGLNSYFSYFSKHKWLNFNENRYCMISDIEKNYNLIGKNKDELIELLGNDFTEDSTNSTIMYDIKYSLVSVQYYILHFENGVIIKTETNWLDI